MHRKSKHVDTASSTGWFADMSINTQEVYIYVMHALKHTIEYE
jgi:hypothetical protein